MHNPEALLYSDGLCTALSGAAVSVVSELMFPVYDEYHVIVHVCIRTVTIEMSFRFCLSTLPHPGSTVQQGHLLHKPAPIKNVADLLQSLRLQHGA